MWLWDKISWLKSFLKPINSWPKGHEFDSQRMTAFFFFFMPLHWLSFFDNIPVAVTGMLSKKLSQTQCRDIKKNSWV
jgi:hypothetical protein